MSQKHPIISVCGSSGSGTTTVIHTFEHIFRRESINAAIMQGDAFHRFTRNEMIQATADAAAAGNHYFSHYGKEANLLEELETAFKNYAETGITKSRFYIHNDQAAEQYRRPVGEFTDWFELGRNSDMLLYEGLHGAVEDDELNIAQHADLKIGIVPVINLEWIQKMYRDSSYRGYSKKEITDTIVRRMPDYLEYICPQFSRTDINFHRVPTVDTSNPPAATWVPTPDESMVVIRFANPRGIDFTYLLAMLHGSFMSRANSIVIPGNKQDLAMQLILTPMILRLMERKSKAL